MNIYQYIADLWATELSNRILKQVTTKLKKVGIAHAPADSGLINLWEEICAQVHGEEFWDWDDYDESIDGLIEPHVAKLGWDQQLVLWLKTDEGWSWAYDHGNDDDGVKGIALNTDAIVEYLRIQLLEDASVFTSRRLERFLWSEEDY